VGQHADEGGGRNGKSEEKDEIEKEFRANPIRYTVLLHRV
jgi:hypothetical protein